MVDATRQGLFVKIKLNLFGYDVAVLSLEESDDITPPTPDVVLAKGVKKLSNWWVARMMK